MNGTTTAAEDVSLFLGKAAAILILIGLLTGGYVAAAMTGMIDADPHTTLASHLSALMGAFLLFGLAWSVPRLGYGPKGLRRIAWLAVVPMYGNWLITAFKALWKVSGVEATGEWRNDVIFGLLNVVVVGPVLLASIAWVVGFFRASRTAAPK
jgi:(hydroxyamino)benzene mutase